MLRASTRSGLRHGPAVSGRAELRVDDAAENGAVAAAFMRVQSARAEDCPAIAELHVRAWRQAYRDILPARHLAALSVSAHEAMWRRMVAQQSGQLRVARTADRLTGFVALGALRNADALAGQAEIWALYVEHESWGTGIGHSLWHPARQRLMQLGFRSVSLWVLADNERAIRFYERAGFVAEPGARKVLRLVDIAVDELRYGRDLR